MKSKYRSFITLSIITFCIVGFLFLKKTVLDKEYYIFNYNASTSKLGIKKLDNLEHVLNDLGFKKLIVYRGSDDIHIALSKRNLDKLFNHKDFHKNDYRYSSFGLYDLKSQTFKKKEKQGQINDPGKQMYIE